MDQLIEFLSKNAILSIALFAVIAMILANELKILKNSGKNLLPAKAVILYNKEDAVFFDMRSQGDFEKGHIPGAINVNDSTIEEKPDSLNKYKSKPVIVYCTNGSTTSKTCQKLEKQGFSNVFNLKGGITAWKDNSLPTEKGK